MWRTILTEFTLMLKNSRNHALVRQVLKTAGIVKSYMAASTSLILVMALSISAVPTFNGGLNLTDFGPQPSIRTLC